VPAVLPVLRGERVRLLHFLRPHVRHALQQNVFPQDRLVLRRPASLESSACVSAETCMGSMATLSTLNAEMAGCTILKLWY